MKIEEFLVTFLLLINSNQEFEQSCLFPTFSLHHSLESPLFLIAFCVSRRYINFFLFLNSLQAVINYGASWYVTDCFSSYIFYLEIFPFVILLYMFFLSTRRSVLDLIQHCTSIWSPNPILCWFLGYTMFDKFNRIWITQV